MDRQRFRNIGGRRHAKNVADFTPIGPGIDAYNEYKKGNKKGVAGYAALAAISAIQGAGPVKTIAKTAKGPVANAVERTFITYTKTNKITCEVYCGPCSGFGKPEDIMAKRDATHHMNPKGFGKAEIDKVSNNSAAIRGREQMGIEANGGAKSGGGLSGNAINCVSPNNPNRDSYMDQARDYFGDWP